MTTEDTDPRPDGHAAEPLALRLNDQLGHSEAMDALRKQSAKRMEAFDCLRNKPPLRDRIAMAKEHMARERQQHDALWPHQQFSLTLGELLDAAERGA